MNTAEKWHGTTIVLLRKNKETVVAGDGQVSLCLLYTSDAADE